MHGSPPPSDSEAGGSRSGSALFHPLPSWNKQMGSFFFPLGSSVGDGTVIPMSVLLM